MHTKRLAAQVEEARPEDSEQLYKGILSVALTQGLQDEDDEVGKLAEASIYNLGRLYSKSGKYDSLAQLLEQIRPFFELVAKAKTAKIVRTIIDLMAKVPGADARQSLIALCISSIECVVQAGLLLALLFFRPPLLRWNAFLTHRLCSVQVV